MLDIKLIRKDPKIIEELLQRKIPDISLTSIVELDHRIRSNKTKSEALKSTKNDLSKKIGEAKRAKQEAQHLVDEVNVLSEKIKNLDEELSDLEKQFHTEMASLPNIPLEEIKVSHDPKENVMLHEFGKKREFHFPFKNHVELNEKLHLFDFKRGAKISGTGWPVYRNLGARLEWALLQYMLEIQIKNGFMQWIPPLLVRQESVYESGQLPKFENQQFKIKDEDYHLYLIPTAEVPLNAMHADEIIEQPELPLQYVAYTPCFRREAGAAGSQERGLIRMHQFNKVEMFCFTQPEESENTFQKMVKNAEEVLQGLELHYRTMLLVTGDMSFAAAKTIDIEVYLPGQNRYYEVSSVSNCTDYQSRRSNIRFRNAEGKLEFVHTLNGSGLATSRLMVALLENNQNEDGSISIPKVLQKYLGGIDKITP
ncbi:Serine--tRNA ligase [Candidatus Rubidus massiliensis]|nr:MAG: serine--tRNA ligase [Chlamydia sp. 32-24]CDZ80847.1 Serine--tRNA ligase [Candidatus Rubidus massiliensis]